MYVEQDNKVHFDKSDLIVRLFLLRFGKNRLSQ